MQYIKSFFFTLAVISVTEFYTNADVFAAKNELCSSSLKYFKNW